MRSAPQACRACSLRAGPDCLVCLSCSAVLPVLQVDTRGEMYNEFVDMDGEVQRVAVGNISDLATVQVEEIGGVPISELQRSIKGLRGGR